MSTDLVLAVGFIVVVLAPIVWLIKSDMAVGAIGVLGGAAVTWFLHKNQAENWGFALVMTLIAAILYITGLVKDSNPPFWMAMGFGIFGALLPTFLGLESTFDPDEVTIPWGWIIFSAALVGGLIFILKKKRS